MLKYLREHNKKILAILGVFLMIAFIIPSQAKRGGRGGGGRPIGTIGNEKITSEDIADAEAEWKRLTSILQTYAAQTGGRVLPLDDFRVLNVALGEGVDATTYYLLLREAQQMQIQPNIEYVNQATKILVDANLAPQAISTTLMHWHMVVEGFETRIASGVKLSPVIAEYNQLDQQQEIRLAMIPFKAEDFRKQLPPATTRPSTQQLEEFFNKYKDKDPGSGDLGFGYRYPKRLALQYLMIPADAIRARLRTNIDLYGVYMDNPERFKRRPEPPPAPTTAPTTRTASTRPTTAPAVAAATTQPSTQPVQLTFDQLTPSDLESLRMELADKGAEELAKKIHTRMAQDFTRFRQADTADADKNAAVKYDSAEYLGRIVDDIWKNNQGNSNAWHDVRPLTNPDDIGRWLQADRALHSSVLTQAAAKVLDTLDIFDQSRSTALTPMNQLAQLPGLGGVFSFWLNGAFYKPFLTPRQREDINNDLMQRQENLQKIKENLSQNPDTAAYYRFTMPQVSRPLQLWEPSDPIRDGNGNYFIFRIIQAEPETPPASLASYIYRYSSTGKDKVLDDYITYQAYEVAKKKASECYDKLQKLVRESKGDVHPISEAAGEFGVKAEFMQQFMKNEQGASPKELPLSSQGSVQFRKAAFDLLHEKLKTGNSHPTATIDVPYDKTIVIARLEDSRSAPLDYAKLEGMPSAAAYAAVWSRGGAAEAWFNPADIRARMQFTPSADHESRTNQPPDNVPYAPPINPLQ